MTRLHDVTVGKFDQFKRVLAEANLDGELVDAVLKQPQLAGGMVGWLREQLAPPLPELFVSLETQLANVRRWNAERNWGFTDADFDAIDLTPGSRSELVVDVVDVIAVYLPDEGRTSGIQRTFEELWDIASSIQPGNGRHESLESDPNHLRLLDGIEHTPGIRRVTLNLGANWDATNGIRPIDVRNQDSVHAEALAAAAHFPEWVRAIDGRRVPFVWMPGYQVTIPGDEAWGGLPELYWGSGDRGVTLSALWDGGNYHGWACPVVVRKES